MRGSGLLLAPLLAVSLLAAAQPTVSDASLERAKALLHEFARSQDPSWLEAHRAQISPEIAKAAAQLAAGAFERQRWGSAFIASSFAAKSFLLLGDKGQALDNMLNAQQAQFMSATKSDEYESIYAQSLKLSELARLIGRADLEFRFIVTAADAAYFQSQGEANPNKKRAALVAALRGITRAAPLAVRDASRSWLERFVRLSAAASENATTDASVVLAHRTVLQGAAAALESAVPSEFAFGTQEDRENAISVEIALANLSYQFGSAESARARFRAQEQHARRTGDRDLLLRLLATHYQAERRANPGANPGSGPLRALRQEALGFIHELRGSYRSRVGRLWAGHQTDKLFSEMLNDQLADPASDPAVSFSFLESMKARVLLDYLTAKPSRELTTESAKALEQTTLGFNAPKQQGDLATSEMRLVSQLSNYAAYGMLGVPKRVAALQALEQLYTGAAAGFEKNSMPATLAEVQRLLNPGEAILEYVQPIYEIGPTNDLWLLYIRRDQVRLAHVSLPLSQGGLGRIVVDGEAPADASFLGDLIANARVAIRTSNERVARAHLRTLYDILVQPLVAQGVELEKLSQLVIVPYGPLHYVPYAALLDAKEKFLISKVPLTVSPSASVWRQLLLRPPAASRYVVIADPKLDSDAGEGLPFAAQEAARIEKAFPAGAGLVLRREQATWERLRAEAPTAGLLHFASHGEFPDDKALDQHALLLAGGAGGAYHLRAEEVRALNLAKANLVVLSVCNGGLYRFGPSDEPYGLMPAFLVAGARSVLGTLWPIDDQFGRDFMTEFYQHLAAVGPVVAYQRASLRFANDNELLRRWAGYSLVGPGRGPPQQAGL